MAAEMEKAVCMTDHFDKIQKLPDPIPGVPNFRRVPGFKVYCCGQPTVEGFEKVLEKVTGNIYPKDGPIIWFNLRQEPTVYVNGSPVCARPPNKIGEYAELGGVTRDIIKEQEKAFLGECEGRKSTNGGKLKIAASHGTSSRSRRRLSWASARAGRAPTAASSRSWTSTRRLSWASARAGRAPTA